MYLIYYFRDGNIASNKSAFTTNEMYAFNNNKIIIKIFKHFYSDTN